MIENAPSTPVARRRLHSVTHISSASSAPVAEASRDDQEASGVRRDTSCPTCHGWSCLACAEGHLHDLCRVDCPDCNDLRMRSEVPWDRPAHLRDRDAGLAAAVTGRPRTVAPVVALDSVRRTRTV